MLIRTTCKSISGKPESSLMVVDTTNGDTFLFNANHVNGIKVRASTKSSFMFTESLSDHRATTHYVESEDTVTNIKARGNFTWQNLFVDLPIYPNNDTAQSTVTTSIYCDSIAYVIKDQTAKATRSWVIYHEGGKLRKVLVGYSINQIYSLADDGNLTTN